jgi:integrase
MLSQTVDHYLSARRGAGFLLEDAGQILQDFVRFALSRGDTHVRTRTVFDWLHDRRRSRLRNHVRLRVVVRLARYAHAEDVRHEIPPANVFGPCRPQRRPPFLFKPDQVEALVRAARSCRPRGSQQPLVYSTLFGPLAATGLRISEALNLQLDDVTPEGLVVRNTKFNKSRLLPLHPTTKAQLQRFLRRRVQMVGACPFVFVSITGRQLHGNTARGVFRRLVFSLGIAKPADRPRPRLHDLRFFFANQVLTNAPGDHDGISRHMVALTTYLGHSDVRNSYWYLEATPALFSQIARRCESFSIEAGT